MLRRAANHMRRLVRRAGFDVKRFAPLENPHLRRQGVLESHGVDLVIDGGANVGQYAARLREYGYRGRIVSLEPGRAAFARLQGAAAGDPLWSVRRQGLGAEAGEAELAVTENSVSSSLLDAGPAMDAVPGGRVVAREPVEVVTLAEVLEGEGAADARCLVKLDVQGAERAALEGAGDRLGECALLEIEAALAPMYAGQADALELLVWLRGRGFELVGVAPNTLDPRSGHALEVDALLARRAP